MFRGHLTVCLRNSAIRNPNSALETARFVAAKRKIEPPKRSPFYI
jgi:hypothetical protein